MTTDVTGINAGVKIGYYKLICTCGFNGDIIYGQTKCPSCGTTNIIVVDSLNKKGRVRFDSKLEVIEKDDRYFHVRKKELYIYIEEDETARLKIAKVFDMKWSLKDRTLEVWRNGRRVENPDRYDSFFRGITHEAVLNAVATDGNRKFLKWAFEKLGRLDDEKSEKLTRALVRAFDYPNMELFNFAGFSHVLDNIWEVYAWKTSSETKPHKILGVQKYMLKYLKKLKDLKTYATNSWMRLDEAIGGNNLKTILEVLDDESDVSQLYYIESAYLELVTKYGYKNHKHLIKYLARELKLHQGITTPQTGVTTLRDYVRMCTELGINPEKYSKNLKKDHDIAAMNFRMMKNESKLEEFKAEMSNSTWDKILYKNDAYSIVKPNEPNDLIKEGDSLGHCVASYVEDVIKGRCKIFFLRLNLTPDEGLVTVEVRGNEEDGLRVVQVRGAGNRDPYAKEKAFIDEWAKKKNLRLEYGN